MYESIHDHDSRIKDAKNRKIEKEKQFSNKYITDYDDVVDDGKIHNDDDDHDNVLIMMIIMMMVIKMMIMAMMMMLAMVRVMQMWGRLPSGEKQIGERRSVGHNPNQH